MSNKRHTPGTIDPLSLTEAEQEMIKRAAAAHPAPINVTRDEQAQAASLAQQGYVIANANNVTATELGLQASSML